MNGSVRGRENAKIYLKENNRTALEIEDKIRAAHGLDFEMPVEEKKKAKKEDDDDSLIDV